MNTPDLIGICFDCEERFWFEVDRLDEPCPEDHSEWDHPHNVVYYRRTAAAGASDSSTSSEATP